MAPVSCSCKNEGSSSQLHPLGGEAWYTFLSFTVLLFVGGVAIFRNQLH